MKTLNKKIIFSLIIVGGLFLILNIDKNPDTQVLAIDSQPAEITSNPIVVFTERLAKKVNEAQEIDNSTIKEKPSIITNVQEISEPVKEIISHEKTKILRETQAQNNIVDENWDETNYVISERENQKNLSFEALLAEKTIQTLESQLAEDMFSLEPEDEKIIALQQYLETDIDPNYQLLNLQCSKMVCQVVSKISDAQNQKAFIRDLTSKFDWPEKSYADIKINADDSRLVTLYLTPSINID